MRQRGSWGSEPLDYRFGGVSRKSRCGEACKLEASLGCPGRCKKRLLG